MRKYSLDLVEVAKIEMDTIMPKRDVVVKDVRMPIERRKDERSGWMHPKRRRIMTCRHSHRAPVPIGRISPLVMTERPRTKMLGTRACP